MKKKTKQEPTLRLSLKLPYSAISKLRILAAKQGMYMGRYLTKLIEKL
jgi:hypothetical protein